MNGAAERHKRQCLRLVLRVPSFKQQNVLDDPRDLRSLFATRCTRTKSCTNDVESHHDPHATPFLEQENTWDEALPNFTAMKVSSSLHLP